MSTKPSPHNISHANVRDTCATTTILEPMSTKPSPATFLELSVRPLGLAIPGASLLPYALCSFFPFVMCSRSRHSLPVTGLLSGLGGYRVALTISSLTTQISNQLPSLQLTGGYQRAPLQPKPVMTLPPYNTNP